MLAQAVQRVTPVTIRVCDQCWLLSPHIQRLYQAAWLALSAIARREHPGLCVVYAMLAGGAPLLRERVFTRGGPAIEAAGVLDFYDTSSYGPVAVEAMAREVGPLQLLHGSDRPVAEPVPTGREAELRENGSWLASAAVAA